MRSDGMSEDGRRGTQQEEWGKSRHRNCQIPTRQRDWGGENETGEGRGVVLKEVKGMTRTVGGALI
jgi:hypothetical protein